MVLLNATKAARNVASLVNRPTCGGPKKAGLGYTGVGITSGRGIYLFKNTVNTQFNNVCIGNYSNSSQVAMTFSTRGMY
jgi:hypothetical protein